MSELRIEVNDWDRRAKNKQLTDLEAIADSGQLSKFWDFEEPPKVLRLLNLKKGERILDAGCGSGRYLIRFAKLNAFVVGVDASASMLRRAKARTRKAQNVFLVRGDIMNLPIKSGFFDALVSISVLQHLPSRENFVTNEKSSKNAIREFGRVTKTKGRIVVLFPNLYNLNSLLNLITKWFMEKIYEQKTFMYYTTIPKAREWFEDEDLRMIEVVARGFYFPFRVGNMYIIPRKIVFRYLSLFESLSSLVNTHLGFLKTLGHSFLMKALKITG